MKNWLIKNKNVLSIRGIEQSIGCSRGTLSKVIEGKRPLPKKWEQPLRDLTFELSPYIWEEFANGTPAIMRDKTETELKEIVKKYNIPAQKFNGLLIPSVPKEERANLDRIPEEPTIEQANNICIKCKKETSVLTNGVCIRCIGIEIPEEIERPTTIPHLKTALSISEMVRRNRDKTAKK